jgi:hypothetical protein
VFQALETATFSTNAISTLAQASLRVRFFRFLRSVSKRKLKTRPLCINWLALQEPIFTGADLFVFGSYE